MMMAFLSRSREIFIIPTKGVEEGENVNVFHLYILRSFFCDVENLFILQLLLILHGMFLNLVKENEIVFFVFVRLFAIVVIIRLLSLSHLMTKFKFPLF